MGNSTLVRKKKPAKTIQIGGLLPYYICINDKCVSIVWILINIISKELLTIELSVSDFRPKLDVLLENEWKKPKLSNP